MEGNDVKDTARFITELPNVSSKYRKLIKPMVPTDDGKIRKLCDGSPSSVIALNRSLIDAKYMRCGISKYIPLVLKGNTFD